MENRNEVTITFDAYSVNEGFARMVAAAFAAEFNPTKGKVHMALLREEDELTVSVEDFGKGIADIEKAKEPFFTTKPELERSGMGFAFMEAFMDSVLVESVPGTGTKVTMKKYIRSGEA